MTVRSLLTVLALASGLAVSACGSDEPSGEAAEENATPRQAIAEIGTVRANLDKALQQVRAGDRSAAQETLAENYTEHFEKVEGPLREVDHELNEQIEETLSTDLRTKVRDGAPASELRTMVAAVKRDLVTAATKLEP